MTAWRLSLLCAAIPVIADPANCAVALETVVDRLRCPIYVTHAGDGSGRMFIVEREGRIRILDREGNLLEKDFLNLGSDGLDRARNEDTHGRQPFSQCLSYYPSFGNRYLHLF